MRGKKTSSESRDLSIQCVLRSWGTFCNSPTHSAQPSNTRTHTSRDLSGNQWPPTAYGLLWAWYFVLAWKLFNKTTDEPGIWSGL